MNGKEFWQKIKGKAKEVVGEKAQKAGDFVRFGPKGARLEEKVRAQQEKMKRAEKPSDSQSAAVGNQAGEETPSNLVYVDWNSRARQEQPADANEDGAEDNEDGEEDTAEGQEEAPEGAAEGSRENPSDSDARNRAVNLTLSQMFAKAVSELNSKGGIGEDSYAMRELEDSVDTVLAQEVKIIKKAKSDSTINMRRSEGTDAAFAEKDKNLKEAQRGNTLRRAGRNVLGKLETGAERTERQTVFGKVLEAGLGTHKAAIPELGIKKGAKVESIDQLVTKAEISKDRVFLAKMMRGEKKESDTSKRSANEKVIAEVLDSKRGQTLQEMHTRTRLTVESLSTGIRKDSRLQGNESFGEVIAKNEDLRQALVEIRKAKENLKRIEGNIKRELASKQQWENFKKSWTGFWKPLWNTTKESLLSLDIGKAEKGANAIVKSAGGLVYNTGGLATKKLWELVRNKTSGVQNYEG